MAGIHDHTHPGACIPCAIKHVGAAMVHLGEALASSDPKRLKRRLLEVTFDLNEAETTHLSDRYPELAKEIREIRKKIEEVALDGKERPDVTREDLEKLIDKLLEYREREEEQEVICPGCVRVSMDSPIGPDLMNINGDMLRTPKGQRMVLDFYERLAKKYNVPAPQVYFKENTESCPGTSCSVLDDKNPTTTTKIYLNPGQSNFNLRSVLHEFAHYVITIAELNGKKSIKTDALTCEALGVGTCDGGSEDEADKFAFREIEQMGQTRVAMDSSGTNRLNSEPVGKRPMETELVMRQEPSRVFEGLDDVYKFWAGVAKITPQEANEAYSPEILGTVSETVFDVTLAPVGQVVGNFILGLILTWAGTSTAVGARDRVMLNEWAAHNIMRLIALANPAYLQSAIGQARTMGNAVAAGKAMDALYQVVKRPEEISSGFRNAYDAIAKLATPARSSGHGEAFQQRPQTAEQGGPTNRPPVFS